MNSPTANPPASVRSGDFQSVLDRYQQKLEQQQAIVSHCASRWSRVGTLRGGLFLLSLVPLFLGFNSYLEMRTPWFLLAGLVFVGFLVVAFIHEGMQSNLQVARLLSTMYRESVARLNRNWQGVKDRPVELPEFILPVSLDLDLFGTNSLYKLLGICRTPVGVARLRDWIVEGALPAEVKERQEAVKELSQQLDWIEKFRLKCEQLAMSKSGPARFVDWCESPNWFANRQWVLWTARLTASVALISILGLVAGLMPLAFSVLALLAVFLINFFMAVFFSGGIHDVFNMISTRSSDINHYVALFDMVAKFDAKSERLKQLKSRMLDRENDVRKHIGSLSLLVWLANLRRHGILFLVYLALEFLFFWDPHVLSRLETWKQLHGAKAKGWFDDLGTWEALCALAVFAADHPGWSYPNVHAINSPTEAKIIGVQIAHPMLDESRVANDVIVGPTGTVLLVSGSNMSGKSTLLRTIGINTVLAQMGTVVCAKEMSLPPLSIESSMKIADSLADGVSFFMAELKRLKQIVDRAKDYHADQDRTMLFLLDEILQGTNSRERQIAVSRVVRSLIDENAIGAISTHDLELATTPELEKACHCVHFSEQFSQENGKRQMTFDYQMKQGVAETTNALKLLEMVGLGEEDQ